MATLEYGYMDGAYLRSIWLQDEQRRVRQDDGTYIERTVTAEEQAAELPDFWKPVDRINDSLVNSSTDEEVVIPVPYDAGDHIAYSYERKYNSTCTRQRIAALKEELSDSDYKVTKCYEASLTGAELPYDIAELHAQRQQIRDDINALEDELERKSS
jgi:hypothetical protein